MIGVMLTKSPEPVFCTSGLIVIAPAWALLNTLPMGGDVLYMIFVGSSL